MDSFIIAVDWLLRSAEVNALSLSDEYVVLHDEGLGQHGMVGSADQSLINLHDGLRQVSF